MINAHDWNEPTGVNEHMCSECFVFSSSSSFVE